MIFTCILKEQFYFTFIWWFLWGVGSVFFLWIRICNFMSNSWQQGCGSADGVDPDPTVNKTCHGSDSRKTTRGQIRPDIFP